MPGDDYDPWSVSSIPCRLQSVRMLLGIAAEGGLLLSQGDFTCAYIEVALDEDVYVEIPEAVSGVKYIGSDGKRRVAKCNQSFFGLHQAGKNFEVGLRKHLCQMSEVPAVDEITAQQLAEEHPGKLIIKCCKSDPNLYVACKMPHEGGDVQICFLCIYSDDVLFASSAKSLRTEVFQKLHARFPFVDKGSTEEGPLSFCGCKIQQEVKDSGELSYTISQPGYIRKLLKDNKMDEANSIRRPTAQGMKFSKEDQPAQMDLSAYRKMAGGILWAAITCFPQIAANATTVCRFMGQPTENGVIQGKKILRYLIDHSESGITYRCKAPALKNLANLQIKGYCDADWAADEDSARSTTGNVLMIAGAAFDWSSKLQHTVAMSTAEAECYSLCALTIEIEYCRGLMKELGIGNHEPVYVGVDNKAAVLSAHNETGKRTRHVNIRFHRVRSAVQAKTIEIHYIRGGTSPDAEQVADIMTKSCNGHLFDKFDKVIRGKPDG